VTEPQPTVPEEVLAILRRKAAGDRIAVVGASSNPSKYGNVIVRNLLKKGYRVVPVNPTEPKIEGLDAFPTLDAVPGPVAIVDMVVPPAVGRKVLEGLSRDDVRVVWFQPGSFDDALVSYARTRLDHVVAGACIMVVTSQL